MTDSFEQILEQFPDACLSIPKDGPPTYRGENPHRIIIEGNPDAFRLFAGLLDMSGAPHGRFVEWTAAFKVRETGRYSYLDVAEDCFCGWG